MTEFDGWRVRSPYYNETHEAVAQSVRRFVEREIAPNIDRWEVEGELPRSLHLAAAEAGILGLGYPEAESAQNGKPYPRNMNNDLTCTGIVASDRHMMF